MKKNKSNFLRGIILFILFSFTLALVILIPVWFLNLIIN
jgi:hypothetical protein